MHSLPVHRFRSKVARAALAMALVGAIVGCGFAGESVPLLTGTVPGYTDHGGCFTNFAVGLLVTDPDYGTAVVDETASGTRTPVMWRPGYFGKRVGSEVEVHDQNGVPIATTGRSYQIAGGYSGENPRAFVACGFVNPAD